MPLAIVPLDETLDCGIVIRYVSVRVVRTHGCAHVLRWTADGKRHIGCSVGFGVQAGNMRTVHVKENERAIIDEMAHRLPLLDAEARLPRVDARVALRI